MNKFEKTAVALMFLLLLAWGFYQKMFLTPPPEQAAVGMPDDAALTAPAGAMPTNAAAGDGSAVEPLPPAGEPALTNAAAAAVPTPVEPLQREAEERAVLTNREIAVTVSTWGAGIVRAELLNYPATVEKGGGHVTLDFASMPALALVGLSGLDRDGDFAVVTNDGGTQAVFMARSPDGLELVRTISLGEGYVLSVSDSFSNRGATPIAVPGYGMQVGSMDMMGGRHTRQDATALGIDTLPDLAGRDVDYWAKKRLPAMFGGTVSSGGLFGGCARQSAAGRPEKVSERIGMPVSWTAVKNKFFVQILRPTDGAVDCELMAERDMQSDGLAIARVAATVTMAEKTLAPGESFRRDTAYYVGSKKHSVLKSLGYRQDEIMQFGWWAWFRWVCVMLLATLNAIYAVIPNYGVAIILLTIIVKILFWPLTHKGTESAKRMQKLQPLLAELRVKYKNEPQKMQQAQMALYREHKVNPMASCLPMLVQLPIFIALFTVLRSAVELRFADFLWVRDLSEPEGLFAAVLPIPLNILPILMTVTMVWQQKLTPTGGDPQQQKMMMIMPVVMLFILYNMASALVLYWTVSQVLSIIQLMHQHRNDKPAAGSAKLVATRA
jgi:YidC/Oxa1 family membrane protein insertase